VNAMDAALVVALACVVGLSELLARYRADPRRLVRSSPAWLYLALNALAGIGALALINAFGWTFGGSTATAQRVTQLLVAGLGATAFFRSSLFIARVGNTDVGVGPSTVLSVLLQTVDRDVDRLQARQRAIDASEIMKNVSFARAHEALTAYCLALMQNLSAEEQQGLSLSVAALKQSRMSEEVRTLNLGLELMNRVGPEVLKSAVDALGPRIRHTKTDQRPEAPEPLGLFVEAQRVVVDAMRSLVDGDVAALTEQIPLTAEVSYRELSVTNPSEQAAWAPLIEKFSADWPEGVDLVNMSRQMVLNRDGTQTPVGGVGALRLQLLLSPPTGELDIDGEAEVRNGKLIFLAIEPPDNSSAPRNGGQAGTPAPARPPDDHHNGHANGHA
jgi:hypothetical protein